MASISWLCFFIAVAGWTVGVPCLLARCNLRNNLPISYGWATWQTRSAMRNFTRQDWQIFAGLAIGSLTFGVLAFALGFPGADA